MVDELWNKPMIWIGLALSAAGIGCWKMFATNEEIFNDESLTESEKDGKW